LDWSTESVWHTGEEVSVKVFELLLLLCLSFTTGRAAFLTPKEEGKGKLSIKGESSENHRRLTDLETGNGRQ